MCLIWVPLYIIQGLPRYPQVPVGHLHLHPLLPTHCVIRAIPCVNYMTIIFYRVGDYVPSVFYRVGHTGDDAFGVIIYQSTLHLPTKKKVYVSKTEIFQSLVQKWLSYKLLQYYSVYNIRLQVIEISHTLQFPVCFYIQNHFLLLHLILYVAPRRVSSFIVNILFATSIIANIIMILPMGLPRYPQVPVGHLHLHPLLPTHCVIRAIPCVNYMTIIFYRVGDSVPSVFYRVGHTGDDAFGGIIVIFLYPYHKMSVAPPMFRLLLVVVCISEHVAIHKYYQMIIGETVTTFASTKEMVNRKDILRFEIKSGIGGFTFVAIVFEQLEKTIMRRLLWKKKINKVKRKIRLPVGFQGNLINSIFIVKTGQRRTGQL
ncbi:hypothetical protein AGLY_003075 [Aphis glycines]|uniref:Uncharacterized protein n=1 Tax=Aphis glycines TaxID=307491 RepID=A0A6G0U263_APHGL|nr:hypothetical protein AGLY_003075 [Aphis glycines]